MAKTVTCLFNSEAQASSVIDKLEDTGLSRGKICMFTGSGNNRFWDNATGFDDNEGGADNDRVDRYLRKNGVPSDDARAYAEGVRRGHTLVAVRCDDNEVDWVVDVLDDDDVVDLDERQDAWRQDGWKDQSSGVAGLDSAAATPNTSAGFMGDAGLTGTTGMAGEDRLAFGDRMTSETGMLSEDRTTFNDSLQSGRSQLQSSSSLNNGALDNGNLARGDEVIPVAEEQLRVGKREVSHGRVRIRSHVIERPVEEQVSLREERVAVERRPVEGSLRAGAIGDDNLFQERTIEVEERSEEAVVSKEARVVEEVVVRKEADQRTETVSDTVRKTEVEVEDERGNTTRTGTTDIER